MFLMGVFVCWVLGGSFSCLGRFKLIDVSLFVSDLGPGFLRWVPGGGFFWQGRFW